jgi:uncharacterized protein with ParB-like and HNH nuclease domain
MKASETKLQRILEGQNQYVVPLFQRPYSWGMKQWTVLWDDLTELCEEDEPRNHFMGSIVTAPAQSVPEGVAKYLLIDGQQRMTTVFILLAAVRDRAKELQHETLEPEIEQTLLRNMFKQGNETYKLLPTQADRGAFIGIMQGQPVAGDGLVGRVYGFFAKSLRGASGQQLDKLKRVIVNSLLVVSIVLEKDDNPHLIFESLNAKGLPLSQADLIRNYFFMRIHVDEQDALYLRHWKPMQDRLGDDLTECIRHFLMKDGAIVKQGEVYFALKDRADRRSASEVLDYLAELTEFAGYYARLLHPADEVSGKLRERMERLNRIEVTVAYPFLLNVYRDFARGDISEEHFASVLDVLENFMIRRWVCSVPTYGLNKLFPQLYAQSRQHGNLVDGLKAILSTKNYPSDAEFASRLVSTKLYASGERAAKTKLILECLERSHEHQEPAGLDDLTIEHVMPQSLTDCWRASLGENWETVHDLLLHTLGNLTLTGYNAPLSNDPFPQKRVILVTSHVELNRYFQHVERWTEAEIRQRADELSCRALRVWPYFGPQRAESVAEIDTVTGRIPIAVLVLGQRVPATSWRDVAQKTFEAIAQLDAERFEEIVRQFPRFLGRDATRFRSSRLLCNGVSMETNLSASAINAMCVQVTEAVGLSSDDWSVECA